MTQPETVGSISRKIAVTVIVLLSIGPFGSSLDLVVPFLHPFPAVLGFRGAGAVAHAIWLAAGVFGVVAITLLVRRKGFLAVAGVLLFAVTYIIGARLVWFQFTPGCWLAIAALVLAAFSAIRREA